MKDSNNHDRTYTEDLQLMGSVLWMLVVYFGSAIILMGFWLWPGVAMVYFGPTEGIIPAVLMLVAELTWVVLVVVPLSWRYPKVFLFPFEYLESKERNKQNDE